MFLGDFTQLVRDLAPSLDKMPMSDPTALPLADGIERAAE